MERRFDHFSYAIAEISKYWHKLASEEMTKYDLKGSYAVYFTTLYHAPEGLSGARLGEQCSRDKADVSRALTVLEERGLVSRENGGKRSYGTPVHLTEKGREVARNIDERAMLAVQCGSRGLDDIKRTVFYEALDVIVANLQALGRDGLPESDFREHR